MKNQEYIWNKLASQWNNFRSKPENVVSYFKDKYIKNKGKIIDLGCGNSRNLIPFKDFDCYGIDFSNEMLKYSKLTAKKYNFKIKLIKSNLDKLPFKNNYFNYALMLASLHNVETKEKRLNVLKELYRILKNNGIALITVWNKWQLKFLFKRKNILIPWKIKDKLYYRYYYLFNYLELKNLIKKFNFRILYIKRFKRNILAIIKKT